MPKKEGHQPDLKKKLTAEDQEKMVARLYTLEQERAAQRKEKVEKNRLHMLAEMRGENPKEPKPAMTKEDEEKLVARIYTQQLELQAKRREHNEAQQAKAQPSDKTLDEEEFAAMVARNYTQALERKDVSVKKLEKTYHQSECKMHGEKLSKEQVASLGQRLSTEALVKKAESRQRIFDRDIKPMDPKSTTISPEALEERLATLYTPKK
jgi:hypothetical protein